MTEYKEREISRNAVIVRCNFGDNTPPQFPVPMRLSRCKDGEEPNIWASAAGNTYATEGEAAYADHMDSEEYKSYWRRKGNAIRLTTSTALDAHNYNGAVSYQDEYYADIDAFIDCFNDDGLAEICWVNGCRTDGFDFDLQDHLESYMSDNHHEDAELDDVKELMDFWRTWAAKQSITSWTEDPKTIVVLDRAAYETELAAARETLKEAPPMRSPWSVYKYQK